MSVNTAPKTDKMRVWFIGTGSRRPGTVPHLYYNDRYIGESLFYRGIDDESWFLR